LSRHIIHFLHDHDSIEFFQFLGLFFCLHEHSILLIIFDLQFAAPFRRQMTLTFEFVVILFLLLGTGTTILSAWITIVATSLEVGNLLKLLIEHNKIYTEL